MENYFHSTRPVCPGMTLSKLLLTMKITALLLIAGTLNSFAVNSYSQSAVVSVDLKNATVEQILNEIENNSEYFFLFNQKLVDVSRKVDLSVKNTQIKDILAHLFENSDIEYNVYDRQIILAPKNTMADMVTKFQQNKVTGKVIDAANEEPLPGVYVIINGTNTGVITDASGVFSIETPESNSVLSFSFIGYNTETVSLEGRTFVEVRLIPDVTSLEEVVVVGYGIQKKATVTGSISSVKSQQLTIAPVAQASNTLAGRLAGLISSQVDGRPGADQAALNIRGFGNPLVIVDGIEADLNTLDPSSIESVSILKDGSASIYGSRAGNGVILVTTKRGTNDKPIFTLNTSFSGQGITYMPHKASSGQMAEMAREEHLQSGKPEETAPWTEQDIQKFYDGTDPNFVNTDWEKVLIRDWAPMQQHQLSVRGGSERVKYYGLLGYLNQETVWKTSGGVYKRYNLQSNIDIKLLDNLDFQLDLAGILTDSDYPYRLQSEGYWMWFDYSILDPKYHAWYPDRSKLPYLGTAYSIWQSLDKEIGGYDKTKNQRISGTLSLNYQFKHIKGLSAKGLFNYLKDDKFRSTFLKGTNMWNWDAVNDLYTLAASSLGQTQVSRAYTFNQQLTMQLSLDYDRTFGDHKIKALAVSEIVDYRNDYLSGSRLTYVTTSIDQLFAGTNASNDGRAAEMGRASFVGRLNYSYKDKYLFESIIRADASAKFPSEKRWGYFPSVSLGWRISEESFMDNIEMLDNLKLRASFGQSGNDVIGNFQYLSGYTFRSGAWSFGSVLFGDKQMEGIYTRGLENSELTWEKISIYNVGFDFDLWRSKLYGEGDVFYRERNGILATRIFSLPNTFGAALPPENLNSLNDRGFELKIGTHNSFGDFNYDISGILSWSRAKWMHFEEPDYTDPDQLRINKKSGQWTDRYFGYLSDGLFTDQGEIDNLGFDQDQQGNKTLRPGDVRYVDVNGDKVLDWKDQVEIGKGTAPHWMVGLNFNLIYKNFDLTTLWQGALGFYKMVSVQRGTEEYYNLRWTPENNDRNALVSRLGGVGEKSSDRRYKKADYMRLKSASIGYTLPREWTNKISISGFRIYASGINLLTFNPLKDFMLDPEAPSGEPLYYPQQRSFSFGATVTF